MSEKRSPFYQDSAAFPAIIYATSSPYVSDVPEIKARSPYAIKFLVSAIEVRQSFFDKIFFKGDTPYKGNYVSHVKSNESNARYIRYCNYKCNKFSIFHTLYFVPINHMV
jgi:hypothetical protein